MNLPAGKCEASWLPRLCVMRAAQYRQRTAAAAAMRFCSRAFSRAARFLPAFRLRASKPRGAFGSARDPGDSPAVRACSLGLAGGVRGGGTFSLLGGFLPRNTSHRLGRPEVLGRSAPEPSGAASTFSLSFDSRWRRAWMMRQPLAIGFSASRDLASPRAAGSARGRSRACRCRQHSCWGRVEERATSLRAAGGLGAFHPRSHMAPPALFLLSFGHGERAGDGPRGRLASLRRRCQRQGWGMMWRMENRRNASDAIRRSPSRARIKNSVGAAHVETPRGGLTIREKSGESHMRRAGDSRIASSLKV